MLDKNLQHWSPYNFFECWVHHMKCVVKSYGPSWTFWLNSFLQTNKLHFILYTQKYYSETLTTFGILWFILECQPKLRKSQKCLSHFNMSNLSTSFEDQPALRFDPSKPKVAHFSYSNFSVCIIRMKMESTLWNK